MHRAEELNNVIPAMYQAVNDVGKSVEVDTYHFKLAWRLGMLQLNAPCSWYEYDCIKAYYRILDLSSTHFTDSARDSQIEIQNLQTDMLKKHKLVKYAKEQGNFYSVIPLLDHFMLPQEARDRVDFRRYLPGLIQKALTISGGKGIL